MRINPKSFRLGLAMTALLALLGVAAATMPVSAESRPAIKLQPGQSKTTQVQGPKASASQGALIINPTGCASAQSARECDVHPLVLERDPSEDALNFVIVKLAWDGGATIPPLSAVAAGLTFGDAIQYDMYLFHKDDKGAFVRVTEFDTGLANPEIEGFTPIFDEYFLTVQITQGASLGYELTVELSSERFDSPFEILDPAFAGGGGGGGGGGTAPSDFSGDEPGEMMPFEDTPAAGGDFGFDAPLAPFDPSITPNLAPVEADADFRGFGGGIDNGLVGDLATFTPPADVAPVAAAAPGAASLLFWLLLVPLGFAGLMFVALRRRRPPALAG